MADTANPFDDAANEVMGGQSAAIRNNVYNAMPQNAAQVSEHAQLADQLGIPIQSVQADPMTAKQRAAMQNMDVQKVVSNHPHLADFMTDPTNAAQVTSNGDVPNMANLEASIKNVPAPTGASAPPNLENPGLLTDAWTGVKSTANQVYGAWDKTAVALNDLMPDGTPGKMTPEERNAFLLRGAASQTQGINNAPKRWTGNVTAGLSYLPFMEAAPWVVGATTGTSTTQGLLNQGVDADTANKAGYTSGPIMGAAQMLPMGNLLFGQGAGAFAKSVLGSTIKAGGVGAGQELATDTGVSQILKSSGYGQLADQYAPSIEKAWDSALFMAGLHLGTQTGIEGGKYLMNRPPVPNTVVQDTIKTDQAVQSGEALQQISTAAQNTQLRANNPQAFKDFVAKVTDDGHLPEVYIDGQTLVNALHQSGKMEQFQQQMPEAAAQLTEALHTNGDVRIPTEDYATHLASPEMDALLIPHLKTDPEGMTYQQGQDHLAQQQAEMTQQAQEVTDKQKEAEERATQLKAITDNVQQQLEATGRYSPDQARQYAAMHGAFMDNAAERMGLTPAEMQGRLPLKITGDMTGGESFRQPDLTDGNEEHVIQGVAARRAALTPEELDNVNAAQHQFLSNFPEAIKYGHESPFVRRLRAASDDATLDIGGDPKTARVVDRPLGPFSNYRTEGEVVKGATPAQDKLHVNVYGKEQVEQGLTDTPALKFTVDKKGELIVNGPDYHSPDMDKFVENGWADHVQNKEGETQWGWTHLLNPSAPHGALPRSQVADLLADVHARQHAWTGQEYAGLHWTRATGATGSGEGRESAMYGQPAEGDLDHQPENRGFYNPATGEMGLLKDADLSTFLHESGHYFLEAMHGMAQHPDAPQGVKDDFDTLLQHFGVQGETPEARMADWSGRDLEAKRDGHEQFAQDFEKYLFDGKAPTPELQSMFSRFRSWLMSVYGSMKGNLSPEVQGVMDRMFASQEAIAEAERVRGYLIPDLPAEHGELIDQYKALGHEATEQAIAEMQARSMRDLKWANNAMGRRVKDLQKTADTERAKIKEEVTKEVMDQPVNQARTWLTKGEMKDENGNPVKAEKGFKLNTNDLREMFPKDSLTPLDLKEVHGMTSEEGLHPDLVADMFGFNSGKELIGALTHGEKPEEQIAGMTDQRMLERHGDLVDPVSVQRAAEAAIHNEVRAKMMATGLKMFTKSPMSVNEINKAAKAAADTAIAAKKVGDVRPAQYSAAESKANKELLKLAPKDPAGAAAAQRAALLNNRLFKSASEAVIDVQKGLQFLKRFSKDSTRAKIEVDIRDQIDDILQRFDLRKNPTDAPTRAQRNLQDWVDSQVAAGMSPSVTPEMLQPAFKMPYREMSVEQFRGMVDSIKSMEEIGKTRQSIMVNGEKQVLREYADNEIIPKLLEYGEHFTPEQRVGLDAEHRGLNKFQSALETLSSFARAANAELKPQDFAANILDRHQVLGPIYRSIFEPIIKGSYDKVAALKALSDEFAAKAKDLGPKWQKSLHDFVEGHNLLDPDLTEKTGVPTLMKISRAQMLMIALHSGNESNFHKLTDGYKWAPAQVWDMLNHNMGGKDIDAVNKLWELNEKHWPEVEALYREMGQTVPPKIEARPTSLKNGDLTGGYARISYDPKRSRRGAAADANQAKEIQANGVSVADYFKRTGTANGSMNARMEGYTDKINLDFHTVAQAMQETLHDLYYRRGLVDANKIMSDAKVKDAFLKTYGPEQWQSIMTWMGRVANSANADANSTSLAKVLQYSRTGMVINGIGFNVATVGKHGGAAALKSLGFMAGGGEKYFASRMASMFHDYTNQVADAKAKFSEIAARSMQQDRDFGVTSSSMFEPDNIHAKLDRAGHAMIAALDLFSAVPTAHAAYDRAVTEGVPVKQGGTGEPMTHADAVAYANKMVREAHGSNVEAARSNFMNNPDVWMKQFGALYGFMNNTYGQMANITSKLMTPGLSKPVAFAQAFAAILVPALATEAMDSHFHKDDDESWGLWIAKAIGGEVAGSVPFVRDAVSMVKGMMHAGQVPVESWLQSLVNVPMDLKDYAQGKGNDGKMVQDTLNAVGTTRHLPLGQLAKTLRYYIDQHEGKAPEPENALHQVTDPLLGAPHKK